MDITSNAPLRDPHEPVLPEGQQSPMAISAPETEAPKLDEQLAETCVDQKAADEKQIAENEAQS